MLMMSRIHYPLALSYAGQADSGQLRNTITRLAAELEKYKRQVSQSHTSLTCNSVLPVHLLVCTRERKARVWPGFRKSK